MLHHAVALLPEQRCDLHMLYYDVCACLHGNPTTKDSTSLRDKVALNACLMQVCNMYQASSFLTQLSSWFATVLLPIDAQCGMSCALQIDKCFGFESAVEESQRALLAGYVEAASARSGLGLIKLMGRQSGYIAMQASMASGTPP